jgi:hypothetical protein
MFPAGVPAWIDGVLKPVLKTVDFVGLVPTVAAIAFAPDHFFRRVGPINLKGSRLYKPLPQFALPAATLILSLLAFTGVDVRTTSVGSVPSSGGN